MHKYYKLKIYLENYEDRLFRTILFNYNKDLDELAFTILSIFNTASYHLYSFQDDKKIYMCKLGIDNSFDPTKDTPTEGFIIDDLFIKNNKFIMLYDFGETYVFIIEITDIIEEPKLLHIARVIDGRGYGIAEDQHHELDCFLNGEPCYKQVTFFYKGKFNVEHDFEDFNIEDCNTKLKREIYKIRAAYLFYDL